MVASVTHGGAIAMSLVFPIVSALAIFVRFYIRQRRAMPMLADDWLCIPAWVLITGLCSTIIYAVERDLFVKQDLPVHATVNKPQREFAAISSVIPVLWLFGAACVKFSILAFYRRIFVGKTFNAVSWFLITLNALWTGYAFFAWLFFCGRHVKENFEGSWKVCPSWGTKMQIGVFSWDTLIDFCLLATPIPFIIKLQMSLQRKFELLFAFLLGSLAAFASSFNTALQLTYIIKGNILINQSPSEGPDLTFWVWQTIEFGVGLITCNLPTLQPLYNCVVVRAYVAVAATKKAVYSWRTQYADGLKASRKEHISLSPSYRSGSGPNSGEVARSGGDQAVYMHERLSSVQSRFSAWG